MAHTIETLPPAPLTVTSSPIADPGPLGLSAFAVTTFVLSSVNAGLIPLSVKSVVLTLALFYGGIVQLVAGIWEFKKNNTFGATAFCSYGAFWLAYWGLSVFFKPAQGTPKADIDIALGFFLLSWTIFTAIMMIAVLRTNRALIATFGVLVVTFVLLTAGHFLQSEPLEELGGWAGLVTAGLAFYTAFAGVVNETWKQPVIPVWKV